MKRFAMFVFVSVWCVAGQCRAAALPTIEHQVLAFYYGWYAPQYGAHWLHHARWIPADGEYDSLDPAVITRQVAAMKQAGITGIIASWWGIGAYTDRQLALLLPIARQYGLVVTVLVEDIGSDAAPGDMDTAVQELRYVFGSYEAAPNWLKVNGRPVAFVYDRALNRLHSVGEWNNVLQRVRTMYPGAIVLAPGQHNPQNSPLSAAAFDGLYNYGITDLAHGTTLPDLETHLRKANQAIVATERAGEIACLTVEPGYDDSKSNRPPPRPIVQRFDGDMYRASWRAALAGNPDWVLISTFNEWIEGSQIEASTEFGTKALDDTATFSRLFLSGTTRPAVQ